MHKALVMVAHTCNHLSSLREVQGHPSYVASWRPAWATWDPVSLKKKKNKQTRNHFPSPGNYILRAQQPCATVVALLDCTVVGTVVTRTVVWSQWLC